MLSFNPLIIYKNILTNSFSHQILFILLCMQRQYHLYAINTQEFTKRQEIEIKESKEGQNPPRQLSVGAVSINHIMTVSISAFKVISFYSLFLLCKLTIMHLIKFFFVSFLLFLFLAFRKYN